MNPFSTPADTGPSFDHISEDAGTVHDLPFAPNPFRVGQRLALNTSFAGIDHTASATMNVHNKSLKYMDVQKQGFSPLVKTQSIPIINRMKRTPSELQLREDEELADYRDYIMFSRIVDRMSRSQKEIMSRHLRHENDQCLAHVIGTRNGCADDVVYQEFQKQRHMLPLNHLQPPQTAASVPTHGHKVRVVSMANMDSMLAVDAADPPFVYDDDDFMFHLEL